MYVYHRGDKTRNSMGMKYHTKCPRCGEFFEDEPIWQECDKCIETVYPET